MLVSTSYVATCFLVDWKKQTVLAQERTRISNEEQLVQPDRQNGSADSSSIETTTTTSGHAKAKLILRRVLLTACLLAIFLSSLGCRLYFRWVDVFGVYCIFENGTYVRTGEVEEERAQGFALLNNCTLFAP
uniref:Uncharacterized protein n=2 Tax=Schistocephalus solidus TaxID=70667 RepID=A0A0X3PE20_SCHSO